MDLATLKKHITTNQLNSYYIFTGPEVGVMDIYISEMAKVKNAKIVCADSITEILQKVYARSLLRMRCIYVLRDDSTFIRAESLKLDTEQIRASESMIIFVYTSIDKRSKFYKRYEDDIITFDRMRLDVLLKYMQRVINLSKTNLDKLAEVCEQDYSRILLEVDKIKHFCEATHMTEDEAFIELLHSKTIHVPAQDVVFSFVDAVLDYKPKQAFRLLEESYASGEATLVLLSNLYNNTKYVLQYQTCESSDIGSSTGLTSFQIRIAKTHAGVYSNTDLMYLMRLIQSVESGIKRGDIDDDMAVSYILVNFF